MRDVECVGLLQWALPRLGLRWAGFRKVRRQVCKRIARRMQALAIGSASAYRARLGSDPGEWDALDGMCRVTISRFLRDRAVWEHLGQRVLPEAARLATLGGGTELRCWSAGCASGEEPYGIALLFRLAVAPAFPGLRLRLVATDADEAILERARRGCYPPGAARSLPADWLERAFETRDGELCLRPEFREPVELRREDLRRAMPQGPFHLVLCRNLAFTYFDGPLQRRVLEGIAARLEPGGFLVVGAHESLPASSALAPAAGRLPVYCRR
jgi:chemotaxis protein methyltransferase CheR